MVKTKMISTTNEANKVSLESKLNRFFKDKEVSPEDIFDIKYDKTVVGEVVEISALVIYVAAE